MTDDRMRAAFALVPDWVDDRVTDGTSMRLYVRLARKYADRQRHAFPGEDVLAEELGCTDRTIRRAIGILGATGALIITRERKADGHFGRNLYYLPTEDPSGTNGRKQTSSGGRKQTSGGRRKQVSGLPEEAGFRSEPDPLNPDPRSNQTSEANASDTDADAPRRASNGDGNPTGADEDPKSGGSKDQNRQEENGQGVPAEPTLFDSWSGFDQPPNSNGSSRRSTGAPEPNTRRRKRDDLTDEQTSDVTRIVAAWVDAYRAAHTGVQPSVSKKGRAAREIRALISAGNDPARVLAAAESAARRGYATVETELGQLSNGNGRARVHVPYQNPSDTSAYHGTLR